MIKCTNCKEEFTITEDQISGGGHGMVNVKCPHCGHELAVSEWLVLNELEKSEEMKTNE